METAIKSSLRKIYDAQLTNIERNAIIKELRLRKFKLSEVSEISKLSKGRISQIEHGYECANRQFSFYRWLAEAENIDKTDIPLTEAQKRDLSVLILKLNRILNIKLK